VTVTLAPAGSLTTVDDVAGARGAAGATGVRRSPALLVTAALVAYAALACLVLLPVSPLDSTRLPSAEGDPVQMTWFLGWMAFAVSHGHNPFFTNAINAPYGVNLAAEPSIPLLGLLGTPVTLALGPIATMNLMIRLGLAASAGSFYLVTRRWCRRELAPFIGGCCYALSSPVVSRLTAVWHVNLIWLGLLPVLVYCGERLLVRQRGSPLRVGCLTGLVAGLQYLVSSELLAGLAILAVVGTIIVVAAKRREWRDHLTYAIRGSLAALFVFAVIAGYPIGMGLWGPRHVSGSIQPAAHLQLFRMDLLAPIVPTRVQWADPSFLHAIGRDIFHTVVVQGGGGETGGYLGLPLVALLAWFVLRQRRRLLVTGSAALAVAAFILSLGSHLQVAGHVARWFPLPEAVLAHLPVFDNVVPTRFFVFTVLFSCVVFSVGLDGALARLVEERALRIAREARSSSRARRASRGGRVSRPVVGRGWGLAGAVLLALAALVPAFPITSEVTVMTPALAAGVHRVVESGSRVVAYPFPHAGYDEAMLWQAEDGFRFSLVGGYAYVPRPGGGAQTWPTPVAPAWVEQFLELAQIDRNVGFLFRSAPGDPTRLFDQFLRNSGANLVLFHGIGNHSHAVRQVIESALGRPWRARNGFSSWRVHRRRLGRH
jgi:hypothetical protein